MRNIFLTFLFVTHFCFAGFNGKADFIITMYDEYNTRKSVSQICDDYSFRQKCIETHNGVFAVRAINRMDIDIVYSQLQNDSRVIAVDHDYIVNIFDTPNDSLFHLQWSLNNTIFEHADLDALKTWVIQKGNKSVIIAITDTGINYRHPDLINQMWINADEIPNNNRDDDHNGFVDDIYGWDFANNDNDPNDGNFHGTHVAGTIGAQTNNKIGIAGVMHNVSLMAVKGLFDKGYGYSSDLISGIYYAVDNGADVINASWGGGGFQQAMVDVLQYAADHGVIFVASAGNHYTDNDVKHFYPASYPNDNILSVAASNEQGNHAWFSHYGQTSVDLHAPGVNVISCGLNDGYRYGTGTSMSSPHVSGTLGLMIASAPYHNYHDIIDMLLASVDKEPLMTAKSVSGGRLNAYKALMTIQHRTGGIYSKVDARKKIVMYNHLKRLMERK